MRQCGHCVCATPRSLRSGTEGSRHQPHGRVSTERAASPLCEHPTGSHRAIGGGPRATSATRRRRPLGPRRCEPVSDPRRWRATGPQPFRGPTAFAECDPRTPEPAQRGAGTRRTERRGSLWVALRARPRPTGEWGSSRKPRVRGERMREPPACRREGDHPTNGAPSSRKADARTATTLTRGRLANQRENPHTPQERADRLRTGLSVSHVRAVRAAWHCERPGAHNQGHTTRQDTLHGQDTCRVCSPAGRRNVPTNGACACAAQPARGGGG